MFNLRPELIEKSLKVPKALVNDEWFFKRHVLSSAIWLTFYYAMTYLDNNGH